MRDPSPTDELRTERLLLRRWQPEDEAPMAAINGDPEVAALLNRPTTEEAIAAFHAQMVGHWEQHGFGPWAVEATEPELAGTFLGFAGLSHVPPALAAAGPAPELGWRLGRAAWGRGFATEAALAARDDAFDRLGLPELISIIHPDNVRSERVAEKLGMRRARRVHNPLIDVETVVWEQRADER